MLFFAGEDGEQVAVSREHVEVCIDFGYFAQVHAVALHSYRCIEISSLRSNTINLHSSSVRA